MEKGAQLIYRATEVLLALEKANDQGLGVSELARSVGFSSPTVHRILQALVDNGLVYQLPDSRRYVLGPLLSVLGQAGFHRFNRMPAIEAALKAIADATGDTVFAFLREGTMARCIHRLSGDFPVKSHVTEVGARRALGLGAGGLAMLSTLPAEEVEAIFEANAPAYREAGRDIGDIRADLARAREAGLAIRHLRHLNVTTISVPLANRHGRTIGAISLSAISPRTTGQHLLNAVEVMRRESRALGQTIEVDETVLARLIGPAS